MVLAFCAHPWGTSISSSRFRLSLSISRKNGAGSVDGLVVANTTALRPESLQSAAEVVGEKGGLSGAPLKDASTALLRDLYRYSWAPICCIVIERSRHLISFGIVQ